MESGILITRAIRLSLQATGNAVFAAQARPIVKELKSGEELSLALTGTGVFPEEFRHILAVAEESGRVPEVMRQQCRFYQEEGERRVKWLTTAATRGIWLLYVLFMIVMIYQLASIYYQALPLGR
jgi:type IV pilus assembly protein PilC